MFWSRGKLIGDFDAVSQWPLFSSEKPETFRRRMTSGLPGGTDLTIKLSHDGQLKSIVYKGKNDSFHFSSQECYDNSDEVLEKASGKRFYFSRGDVDDQNRGVSRKVQAHLFRLYQAADVRHIDIDTAQIGNYAWLRLGFAPFPSEWERLSKVIENRLDIIDKLPLASDARPPQKCLDALRKAMRNENPYCSWFAADQAFKIDGMALGKILNLRIQYLPGSFLNKLEDAGCVHEWGSYNWSGSLDMQSAAAVARYTQYLYATPSAPARLPGLSLKK